LEEYSGKNSNGRSDHEHFNFWGDNDDIDLKHTHDEVMPYERKHNIYPPANAFIVPTIVAPEPYADYSGLKPIYSANPGTYTDRNLGVERYLVDNEIVPGQAYTPDSTRQSAHEELGEMMSSEGYEGPHYQTKSTYNHHETV